VSDRLYFYRSVIYYIVSDRDRVYRSCIGTGKTGLAQVSMDEARLAKFDERFRLESGGVPSVP